MNKFTSKLIVFLFLLLPARAFSSIIYVIDDGGYNMDTQWQVVATGMGHTATIQPLTTLNVNTWFSSVDALIVAGGTQTYTAAQMATVQAFLQTGKPVYLQGEYQSTYLTNIAFAQIVNAIGGSFTWGTTQSGNLTPTVTGTYATTNNIVPSLPYFWYGIGATFNSTVTSFITAGGVPLAYTFCPPAGGKMIMTTDQDWINQSTSYPASILLMQNIITHLFNPALCGNPVTVITGTVVKTDVSCFGGSNGSATVTPTNGTGPYTYLWSPYGGTGATATGLVAGVYDVKITAANNTDTGHVSVTITQPAQITSTLAATNVGCPGGNNGSITITPAGGTPGYTYSWAPSGGIAATAANLSAGNYTCTVTDANGCIHVSAVTNVAQPVIAAQPLSTTICDGSATAFGITVTGVTGINYQWQVNTGSGFTDIVNGGAYSGATTSSLSISPATFSMNGYQYRCKVGTTCTSNSNTATLTVKPVSSLTTALNAAPVCSNSPFTYTPAASLAGTSFAWSRSVVTGISNAPAAGAGSINETLVNTTNAPVVVSYSYTLTFNGCAKTQSVTVTVNPQPASTVTPIGPVSGCDTVRLYASTGNFSTYLWKKNGANLPGGNGTTYLANSSGTYQLFVTNQYNCTRASADVIVNLLPTPVTTITYSTPLNFCEGNFVVLHANDVNPMTYTWYLNGVPLNGATTNSYTAYQPGVYTARKTNANGCTSLSAGVTVTVFPVLNPIIERNGNVLTTSGFSSYQWYMNNTAIPGATGASITVTQNAMYQVIGTDANGCITKSAVAWIQNLAVSSSYINPESIKIYPNPAIDIVKVDAPFPVNITVRNMQGQLVTAKKQATWIDISSFAEGVYIITLTDEDGVIVKNERLMKMGK